MISLIIPAHNEEHYIAQCLESINIQIKKRDEIIVVCDACTDNTKLIAKKYTKKVFTINTQNVSAARNYGAQKAKGDVLVFLDADCVAAPNLFEEINRTMQQEYIGGITKTSSLESKIKANIMWFLGNFFRHFFLTASGMLFCKTNFFPGFDETLYLAEDTDLILKLKNKGKLKYVTNSFIKTSSRRLEKEGYFWTIFRQFSAFFTKTKRRY